MAFHSPLYPSPLPASVNLAEALTTATAVALALQKTGHTLLFWGDQVCSCAGCTKLIEAPTCTCPFLVTLWESQPEPPTQS